MTLEEENALTADDPEEDEEEEEEEEEDLVDPMDELKEKCGETKQCAPLKAEFDRCEERVNSRSQTLEDCTEELFDFLHCADHCVSKSLFSKLK